MAPAPRHWRRGAGMFNSRDVKIMCGICGLYHFGSRKPASPAMVRAMADSLTHRGPDDAGFHLAGPLGLGFRRLSIIDLAGGHQPMADPAETVWVAFNGEIYNFQELRRELESLGHRFRTRSDTEVIVHGYRQWGRAVLDRLNGMFGLAIWDAREQRLTLARDPHGIKLVYYRVADGTVLFGSELRAILAVLPEPPAVDPEALALFLRYRYTPSPLTPYRDIRKLAPGTLAVFDAGGWREERWYCPAPARTPPPRSDREAAEELLAIYRRAMRRHLISDVPVGLLLSGGMDSGLLLGLMNEHGTGWPTYTVGYGQAEYRDDELVEAAETARLFDARSTLVELDRGRFAAALPGIVSILEEPVAPSSVVPMYFVCQRARQDVKVALIGQGPDELFGGYTRHLGVRYGGLWRSLPVGLRQVLAAGIRRLPRREALQRGIAALGEPEPLRRYQQVFSLLPGPAVEGLFQDGLLPADTGDRILECWRDLRPLLEARDELGGFQTLELASSLPDELLMYADKLSMAHGLEVRVPYLDREVTEFAAGLPARFKIRRGVRKWLHRRVAAEFLPRSILQRRKRGFAVNAVDAWFQGALDGDLSGPLLDGGSHLFRFLRPEPVRRLLEEHRSGRRDHHKLLFSLVVLEEWLRGRERAHPSREFRRAAGC